MPQLSAPQLQTIKLLAEKLQNSQYAIRGTASLVLQNIDMNVDDIDVICDKETALAVNDLFVEYVVDSVEYKESPKFKSYFGKFNINGVDVEFMGNWQIKGRDEKWSKIYDGVSYNEVSVEGATVRVSTIEDELEMFLLMGRFTAYQKIKRQLPNTSAPQPENQKGLFD